MSTNTFIIAGIILAFVLWLGLCLLIPTDKDK